MAEDKKGQVENILKELGHKIDVLIADAKGAKDEIRDDIEEKISELKSRKDKLEDEFEEFKNDNEGKWGEIKSHLKLAAEEIKKAAEAAFKKE
jgi:predicted  nucleic acid-binding Zn-ribbon protein